MNIQKIGRALHRAHLQQNRYLSHHLEVLGLNPGILPFFICISNSEGLSQKELNEELHIDKTRTAKAVKNLEKQGYVKRRQDEKDHRVNKLYLSSEGRRILPEVRTVLKSLDALISSGYTEEEIAAFIEMLESFQTVLQKSMEIRL